ncbi:MAG: hypothetical protein IKL07_08330, partial [Clostridium sp.]|nr:hypothetical protein [Clostridium sp.]
MKLTKKVSAAALSSVLLLNTIVPAPNASAANDSKSVLNFSECEDLDISSDLKVTTSIWGESKPGYTGE